MYVDVLVEIKSKKLDRTFTYLVPLNFYDQVQIGKRVVVPFGKQKIEGFILDIKNDLEVDYELKQIIDVIDENPVLNKELMSLGKYISKKTLSNLISAYQTMLPSALKAHKDFVINKKYTTYIKLIDHKYIPKNEKQKEIINRLKREDFLKSELCKISLSSVNTLLKNNVIAELKKESYRINDNIFLEDKKVVLNDDQQTVVNKVCSNLNNFVPYLLHGVTGSGKTEVYMNIIEKVLKQKKEIIVLVPEISLTPQIVNIFKSRFKNCIAILHSALSDGEKYDEWRKIERKEVSIVIGARSAVFAPFTNIGLIIVDEEHSDTYKQENNPKYSAIDIAIKRAKSHSCPLVLGSATPSLESYTRAKMGVYKLLELKNRVNKNMPNIEIIDMKNELKKGNRILSDKLIKGIHSCLKRNEQVILFLNRRGYSTTIMCNECGYIAKCPNCDISLTYHKTGNKLTCHYCNYTTFKPLICPSCNSKNINSFGIGTQRLEEEINKLFSTAKPIRMDIDTTRNKGSHARIVNDFKDKKYNILIGTQMISKGLDFEDVTLVGILNGDASLNIPDFRSGERTFALISQVSGRAGRSVKEGKVLIQCFNTSHYSIICAKNNDYTAFYSRELNIRKKLKYPPYYNLTLLTLISSNYEKLNSEALKIKQYLSNNAQNTIILGPSLGIVPKINNKYYIQIILKYKELSSVYNSLIFIKEKLNSNSDIILDIDFQPKKI